MFAKNMDEKIPAHTFKTRKRVKKHNYKLFWSHCSSENASIIALWLILFTQASLRLTFYFDIGIFSKTFINYRKDI